MVGTHVNVRFSIPYILGSQKFFYRSPYRDHNVADGLRQDMREWCNDRVGPERQVWRYWLEDDGIAFYFPTKAYAALFALTWYGVESIYQNDPAPRPGGDIGI